MLKQSFILLLSVMLFAVSSSAQSPGSSGGVKLPPGATVTDDFGVTVENRDTRSGSRVLVSCSGKLEQVGELEWRTGGRITHVVNRSSNGSLDLKVDTGGNSVEIDLDYNGREGELKAQSEITGGNATINVTGDHNDFTVDGQGNSVSMTGNHNQGTAGDAAGSRGSGQGTGGSVSGGGRGNVFHSNGGSWSFVL